MKILMRHKYLLSFGLLLVFAVSALFMHAPSASALSASDWQPGSIIDDSVFFNPHTMTTQDIQTFLNSKVPTCDSNGSQIYSGSQTRAQYSAAHGVSTPFICLKDYSQSVPAMAADAYCGAIPAGSASAAAIIEEVATACNVNPQVILVLLQKETGIVTDDWPWPFEYSQATGYACPDSGSCDPSFAGFFNQVYYGARQYQKYAKQPQLFNYAGGQTDYVAYSPDGNCGGTNVTLQNQATAGLYNYTPYQPDQAALSNLSGTGDSCSSYGNRNFWVYFWNWFGTPQFSATSITMHNISQPDTTPALGQTVSYTVSYTNNLAASITLDAVGIVGRLGNVSNGANRDFGWQGPVTIGAGQTQQFTFNQTIHDPGTIYVWPAVNYHGIYVQYNNWGAALTSHIPNLGATITQATTSPVTGQTDTLSTTIHNYEGQSINLDAAGIPVRFFGQYNYDAGWTSSMTIPASGSSTLISGPISYDKAGPYTEWVSVNIGGNYITVSPVVNVVTSPISPSPQNIQLSYTTKPDITPALGEDVTVAFSLKNTYGVPVTLNAVGVVGRYDNPYTGANNDFGWQGPETFSPGQTKTYSFNTNISSLKNFYAWVAINYQGAYIHYNNWGFLMTPHIPNLSLSAPLTINSPALGQTSSVTATIKNNEPYAIKYSAIGIPGRYYGTYNYDAVWQGGGTLAASGQSGDSLALSGSIKFDKSGPYTVWASAYIQGHYIIVGNQQNLNF